MKLCPPQDLKPGARLLTIKNGSWIFEGTKRHRRSRWLRWLAWLLLAAILSIFAWYTWKHYTQERQIFDASIGQKIEAVSGTQHSILQAVNEFKSELVLAGEERRHQSSALKDAVKSLMDQGESLRIIESRLIDHIKKPPETPVAIIEPKPTEKPRPKLARLSGELRWHGCRLKTLMTSGEYIEAIQRNGVTDFDVVMKDPANEFDYSVFMDRNCDGFYDQETRVIGDRMTWRAL